MVAVAVGQIALAAHVTGVVGRFGLAARIGEVLRPVLHPPGAEGVVPVRGEHGVVPRHRDAVAEVTRLPELDRLGHPKVPQPLDDLRPVTRPLGRYAHPRGTEGAVLARQITDAEQFEVGLAAHQITPGPGLSVGAGGGADLEVGELPQIGGVLDGIRGLPVEHSVGVIEEEQLPPLGRLALLGPRRARTAPDRPDEGGGDGHGEHHDDPQHSVEEHALEGRALNGHALRGHAGDRRADEVAVAVDSREASQN